MEVRIYITEAPKPHNTVRDVATFRASDGIIDGGALAFTLRFPPDGGNREGRADWNLFPDGLVIVQAIGEEHVMHMVRKEDGRHLRPSR